jgi:hypothetical protein
MRSKKRVVRKGKKPTTRFIIWFKSVDPHDCSANLTGWRSLDETTKGIYSSQIDAARAIATQLDKGSDLYVPENFEVRELVS